MYWTLCKAMKREHWCDKPNNTVLTTIRSIITNKGRGCKMIKGASR